MASMPMKKPSKFSKLAMPKKEEMDLSSLNEDQSAPEGSSEEEAAESPEEESSEVDQGEGDASDSSESSDALSKIPDDELMAEMKKRGLMSKMDSEDQSGGDSQDQYS